SAATPMGKAVAPTFRMILGESIAALEPRRAIAGTPCLGCSSLAALIHAAVMLTSARSARFNANAISALLSGMTPGPHAVNKVGEPAKMKYARDVTAST